MSRRRWRGPQGAEGGGRGADMGKMATGGGGGGSGRYYGGGGGSEGGRAPKRLKTESAEAPPHGPGGPGGAGGGAGAGGSENYEDPHKTPASPVVHIRGLIDGIVEADLVEALQEFGPIRWGHWGHGGDSVSVLGTWGQCARDVTNNVLLFAILNPIYSITTDVLYTICNPCGPVQRIVIFRKNGVQAMVEFDSVQSAQRAKASLNGADIYSGCCTLKIEYAKPSRLNVFKNDQDTWDYTNPNLSGTGKAGQPHLGQVGTREGGATAPPQLWGGSLGFWEVWKGGGAG
ncbi:heterogeneous nuclear ribonucleoprotein L-like [Pyrgilauda ruficollis]|uniref:heterogeneous nuclear ribonucleoprotein L-like n=1 Tax=Pyrgilauda ruficollis TaxID=221976 RepID=UPI001B876140|nr:heterogeneous nuclear ribonucleoprotein L-like [Pyrgilauda ruficollis]